MEEFSETGAGTNQLLDLAYNLGFHAGIRAGHCQVQQQQFINEPSCQPSFYSPVQQDPCYSPYQPNFPSQTQPYPYPSLQNSFQNPYNNSFPDSPEVDQNFFQSQDSFQSFQYPACEDPFSNFQNQEPLLYPQSSSNLEFQQESYEPQPLLLSEEQLATLLEARTTETEWLIKLEKKVEELSSVLERAGFPGWNSESEMQNTRQEEEEKACDLMDKAQEWQMEVEESGYVGADLDLNTPGLLQQEEEKEGQNNELQEEEEKVMEEDDSYSYPLFKIGNTLFASSTCQGTLSLRLVNDNNVEGGGVDQDRAELELSILQPEEEKELLPIRKKEGERENTLEEEEYFSLLFREEAASAITGCGVHYKRRRKKKRKKKKKMGAVQCSLLEEVATMEEMTSDLDFLMQEVQSLFQHGFSFKGEGEKEESLQISPSSSHLHSHLKSKESTSSDSDFFLHEVQSITAGKTNEEQLLEVEEVATIQALICDELELFPLKSAQQQGVGKAKNLTVKGLLLMEEEAEHCTVELLDLAMAIHNGQQQAAKAEDVVQLEAQYKLLQKEGEAKELELLQAIHSKKVQQLEVIEELATIELLRNELQLFLHLQSAQQQEEEVREKKNLTENGLLRLVKEEEVEQSTKLLNSALDIHNEQQQVAKEREMQKLAAQWELLVEEEEAELELLLQAAQYQQEQQLEGKEEKKELVVCEDFTLLEGVKEDEELTCADLDILEQEADYLLQHCLPSKEQGEENQISPYSLELLRVKEKDVEDFTSSDFDFLLLEETPIKSGQHLFKEEKKQEEQKSSTPCLQEKEDEVAELHLPQATTPRQKEAAEYPFNFLSFSSEFELTINQFLLSLKLFISGNKLQEQQLPLPICKLQSIAEFGEVHKQGTHGDEVPWFIKVHPP